MDCNDAELLLAARTMRTLTGVEATRLEQHTETCAECHELAAQAEGDERSRWVVRIPEDALEDPDLLVLPTVDPIVFSNETQLAVGGMGRITRVRDRRLGRDVAIKEVLDPAMRARFEREVAITAKLQHPAIVPVYEAGTWPDGSAFYTMRLVSGGTLADAIAKTSTLEERLALLTHVLALTDALAYAHAQGIVHRDLKPGNVLVGEFGETVVIDWGLAKELHRKVDDPIETATAPRSSAPLTLAGSVLGTPGFMAPEQAAGTRVDERADVYALGAILYNLLAGEPPYAGHTGAEILELAKQDPPRAIAEASPRAPADLRSIVERAMAREPAQRYRTAQEMAEELHRFAAGQLLRSREYRFRDLVVRWVRRHRAAVAIGTLAVIALAIVGIGAIVNISRSRGAAEDSRASAEASVVRLLQEQGRAELLAGEREHALADLSEAYTRGADNPALRYLLAEATRDLGLYESAVTSRRSDILSIEFDKDGHLVTLDLTVSPEDGYGELSHDTRRTVTVIGPKIAMLDTKTGAPLWSVDDPAYQASYAVFDPTDSVIIVLPATGLNTHGTRLYDVETGALRATFAEDLFRFAFSDDGKLMAACDQGTSLAVYETAAGKLSKSLPGCYGSFMFFGNDRIVMEVHAMELDIVTLSGLDPPVSLAGNRSPIRTIETDARSGRIAVADTSGVVSLWSAEGELLGTTHAIVNELDFSPDGRFLAGGGRDLNIPLWDASSLELVTTVHSGSPDERGDDTVVDIAWSRDSSHFATMRLSEQSAYVYRAPRGHRLVNTDAIGAAITASALWTVSDGRLVMRDRDTGAVAREISLGFSPAMIAPLEISRDGRRALVASTDGSNRDVAVFDLETGAVLLKRTGVTDAETFHMSTDGRFLLATGPAIDLRTPSGSAARPASAGIAIRVFSLDTGALVRELPAAHPVREATIADDGSRIGLMFEEPALPVVIDVASGASIQIGPFEDFPTTLRFDPSGRRVLALGLADGHMVDAQTGRVLAVFPGPRIRELEAQFDDSGRRVVTWRSDNTAIVWDTTTGARLLAIGGVAHNAFALTGDATRLATGSEDGAIRIFDTASGQLLEVLHAPWPSLPSLRWSNDGTRLAAFVSLTNHAALWDLHLEHRSPAEIAALVPAP